MYKHILAPTDGSELAARGVEHAAGLAASLGARLSLVTVSEDLPFFDSSEIGWSLPPDAIEQARAAAEKRCTTVLEAAAAIARRAGAEPDRHHLLDIRPATGIISVAEREQVDLIVLASHGRRGISRLVLGSQATKVLSLSPVPVLIVKSREPIPDSPTS